MANGKGLGAFCMGIGMVLVARGASAESPSVADLQKALQSANATWTAGETSVSSLPKSEWQRMLGVPLSKIHRSSFLVKKRTPSSQVTTFDWRNVDGTNFVSPMLDQGRCGSCVAFATVGSLETQLNIVSKAPMSPWQLSPQYLFACGGAYCDVGWDVGEALEFVVRRGVPDNACMPYTSGANGTDARCSTACGDASRRASTARSYRQVLGSPDAIKLALRKGPLPATMIVYDDFKHYKSGVYHHVSGDMAGGHAVSIVGFDDTKNAWIVRNSWGPDWGMKGFFEIAYDDESGLGEEAWSIDVQPVSDYVSLGLRDHAVLSGAASIPVNVQGTTEPVEWSLLQRDTSVSSGTGLPGEKVVLDTTSVPDGVYTITVKSGKLEGQPRQVYVLNGTETGSIALSSLKDGDTLSGEAKIDFRVDAKPIPLTEVTFVVTDGRGKEVRRRSTPNTGERMQVAWLTTDVPNGAYTLTFQGAAGSQSLDPVTVHVKVKN